MPEKTEKQREKLFSRISHRAVKEISRTWRDISERTRTAITGRVRPDLPDEDRNRLKKQMEDTIRDQNGETSGKSKAIDLGMTYLQMTPAGREGFLAMLALDFDADPVVVEAKIKILQAAKEPGQKVRAELDLREALIPPRVKLLRLFHALPKGFKFLIDMRAVLLPLARKDAAMEKLDADLKNLLASWFDISLLDLQEITWESPAALLEKLIDYEAVHKIKSWDDLKHRLNAPDRRCFGFFHHKLPGEPLIFVEVALSDGLADNIQNLLDENASPVPAEKADTAIFYSISSTQNGLAGISMGNFLIKRVVEKLSGELKNIKHFATLSPIPGLVRWLTADFTDDEASVLTSEEVSAICKRGGKETVGEALPVILKTDWQNDKVACRELQEPLVKLCAHYLLNVKKRGKAYDPVTHFHLTNGARVERINWLADLSVNGLKQSAGLMVNYYYKLSDINANHENYAGKSTVTASRDVRRLLKK